MSDDIFEDLVPYAERFMECAHMRDRAGMDHVLADAQYTLGIKSPADAIAVVLAELYFVDRERLDFLEREFKQVSAECEKFSRNYVDQKRRVKELRQILDRQAATVVAGRAKVSM